MSTSKVVDRKDLVDDCLQFVEKVRNIVDAQTPPPYPTMITLEERRAHAQRITKLTPNDYRVYQEIRDRMFSYQVYQEIRDRMSM